MIGIPKRKVISGKMFETFLSIVHHYEGKLSKFSPYCPIKHNILFGVVECFLCTLYVGNQRNAVA